MVEHGIALRNTEGAGKTKDFKSSIGSSELECWDVLKFARKKAALSVILAGIKLDWWCMVPMLEEVVS
jgi:hypothetical protein